MNPLATALAGAASHESWMSTRLDPKQAMVSRTLGSSAPQVFDHIADRDRALICRYADTYSARRARHCTRAAAARKPA